MCLFPGSFLLSLCSFLQSVSLAFLALRKWWQQTWWRKTDNQAIKGIEIFKEESSLSPRAKKKKRSLLLEIIGTVEQLDGTLKSKKLDGRSSNEGMRPE